ncbi:hypothetical protein ZIOFF_045551 [Zingiber officinale]|uniref:RRM domain-containing protein n=1 Tax=Zingiber officinale TaxID=94328 RepID=A0A8J5G3F2_ZINOF|nr:hypothetical protein ZIOFF_045551 [Zingiber officinale]
MHMKMKDYQSGILADPRLFCEVDPTMNMKSSTEICMEGITRDVGYEGVGSGEFECQQRDSPMAGKLTNKSRNPSAAVAIMAWQSYQFLFTSLAEVLRSRERPLLMEIAEGNQNASDEFEGDGITPRKRSENVENSGEEMKQADAGSSSAGKIFVGGVAWDTAEVNCQPFVLLAVAETFSNHFSKYGEITDSVIMMDKNTHMPRGFGFVTFADPSIIDKVLEDEHVEVKRTVPREEMPSKAGIKTKKIFVGGIPTSLTGDELKEHFSMYGEVVDHQIMFDHATGRSRGFGFVTFKDEESVDVIISKGKMHDLDGKQVEIKRAEPKRSGGNPRMNERASYDARSGSSSGYRANSYGFGGGRYDMYYGGGGGGGTSYGYGRGYGYGGVPSFGAGYVANYGGYMYGGGGFNGSNMYGGPGGYGGWYGSYGSGSGRGGGYGSRYHPYTK